MTKLPSVLTSDDFPIAELCALRLDGEVFALDGAFCPIDQVERSQHRALALVPYLSDRLIAEQQTAAWIHGARRAAPLRHQLCTTVGSRARANPWLAAAVREVSTEPTDLVLVYGLRVTGPLRTAVDIARLTDNFTEADSCVVARLLALGATGLEPCAALLNRSPNIPYKRRALERISQVLALQSANGHANTALYFPSETRYAS